MNTLIAIPSERPGGLEAAVNAHFGHCEVYTLVSVENGSVSEVSIIPNIPHEHGGCMAPVRYLADKGAKALIAGGMGYRPLMGFSEVGISVFYGKQSPTVGEAVNAFINGELPQFSMENTCGGGDASHSCGNHVH